MKITLGLPIIMGTPAVQVDCNILKTFVTEGDTHGVLEIGRCNSYSRVHSKSYILVDTLYLNGTTQHARILNASPLHLAVQLGGVDVVFALLLLDPTLLRSIAVLEIAGQGSVEMTSLELALLYAQMRGPESESDVLCVVLGRWSDIVESGFFNEHETAAKRICFMGSDTNIVLGMMIILCKKHPWFTLVNGNMYDMLRALCQVPTISDEIESYTTSTIMPIPVEIIGMYEDLKGVTSVTVCGMNILHCALIQGNYEAAAAVMLACPSLVSHNTNIMLDVESQDSFVASASMLVVMFPNHHSDCTRAICAKIVSIAENDVTKLEPLGMSTRSERIAASENDPSLLLSRWAVVACSNPG